MDNIVSVTNKAMVAFFLMHGLKPIDMYIGENSTIVFVYDKDKSTRLYNLYKERKAKSS